ncbi:hypothetical protein EJ05DRAFT_41885 [Pseudovirgaria hyperparasitica]|uniref:Uncharacterized protein n=1 Tax=Pseudovirgaria hyperparasitica TaxID=470096 RepID=A0A6A6WN57_9PEZI|nr:uncharacterized protein EJ05DRAFT_41885 [Pseudovirgaria hyperparasitica]KAF2763516.1 hypothetical protein EJ05DRAFT_41885 [Pseudovirgaria hyperparasitica]
MVQLSNLLVGLTLASMAVALPAANMDIAPAANYRRLPQPEHDAAWEATLVKKHGGPGHHDGPPKPDPSSSWGHGKNEKRHGGRPEHNSHPGAPSPTDGYHHGHLNKRHGGHDGHYPPGAPHPTGSPHHEGQYGRNSFMKRHGPHHNGPWRPSPTGYVARHEEHKPHHPKPTGGYEPHPGHGDWHVPQPKQKD